MLKTEKLGLNILEGTDPVTVDGFNENANLLDAEVSGKASMVALQWDGDDTADKVLTFAKKPLLVFIRGPVGVAVCFNGALYALQHNYSYSQLATQEISWNNEANTLTLHNSGYYNRLGDSYDCVAFLEN